MKPRVALFLLLTCLTLPGLLLGCNKGGGQGAGAKVDLKAQLDALKSPDSDTKQNALAQLATMKQGAVSAVPQLIEALKDPDPVVRRLAAYALMEIGPDAKAALPQLNSMMSDPDRTVVTQVVNTIRTLDTKAMKDLNLQQVRDM
jgi:HEAT repeat protein